MWLLKKYDFSDNCISVVMLSIPATSSFGVGMFVAGLKAAISGAIIGGIMGVSRCMVNNIIFLLNIDIDNRIIAERKKKCEKLHNDSYVFSEHKKKKYLLTDTSFVDEFGYSMYYRIFNVKKFQSISDFIKLYEKNLNKQKKGIYEEKFDESYLFVCTHIQQKIKEDNYFLSLNLLNVNENYNLLFIEGDFDKCTVNVLKKYILSKNQFEEWKKIISFSFEYEVLKDFNNNKTFVNEESKYNEFNRFLESIKYQ